MARIDEFRSQLTGGGARPSQFQVTLTFPQALGISGGTGASQAAVFLVNSAVLPGSTMSPIDVPYRGRIVKVAGERQFQNWNVKVINDNDFKIRKSLEQWSQKILEHTTTEGVQSPVSYATNLYVDQLDRNGAVLRTYKFHNCFPLNVGEIQLDFSATNNIEEFQVEFSVDYWTAFGGGVVIE